jgi:GTP cyclohydrolase I
LTWQVVDFINTTLDPLQVLIEAMHLSSVMQGVKKQKASMTTSGMLGGFRTLVSTRMEFLDNISRGSEKLRL